jgi:hypothetical protein
MIYPISIDKLYCFIYHNDVSHKSALENGNYKIVPLSESPIVKFLEGDLGIYSKQSELFVKRPDSIPFHLGMYELGKMDDIILAIKFEDKYVICDGMHRSSILYYKGHININVTITNIIENPIFANFEPYVKSDKFFDTL